MFFLTSLYACHVWHLLSIVRLVGAWRGYMLHVFVTGGQDVLADPIDTQLLLGQLASVKAHHHEPAYGETTCRMGVDVARHSNMLPVAVLLAVQQLPSCSVVMVCRAYNACVLPRSCWVSLAACSHDCDVITCNPVMRQLQAGQGWLGMPL